MELSSFSENIVVERIERNGDAVELKINIDAILPDYYDHLESLLSPLIKRRETLQEKFNDLTTEIEKRREEPKKKHKPLPSVLAMEKELAEIQREEFAVRLSCPVKLPDGSYTALLKDWSITENGLPIPPTKENLIRLPPQAVKEIWERSIARADTVKKREDVAEEETSENTRSGSRGLHAVGQTS